MHFLLQIKKVPAPFTHTYSNFFPFLCSVLQMFSMRQPILDCCHVYKKMNGIYMIKFITYYLEIVLFIFLFILNFTNQAGFFYLHQSGT